MNFYDLFEAKDDKDTAQSVNIADPKAAYALKKARAKYTYADSDLEAFVKMVQDQEEEAQKEIDDLEAETDRQAETDKELEAVAKRLRKNIRQLDAENEAMDQQIESLKAKEKLYKSRMDNLTSAESKYRATINKMTSYLDDLEGRLSNVKGFVPKPGSAKPEEVPELPDVEPVAPPSYKPIPKHLQQPDEEPEIKLAAGKYD